MIECNIYILIIDYIVLYIYEIIYILYIIISCWPSVIWSCLQACPVFGAAAWARSAAAQGSEASKRRL